ARYAEWLLSRRADGWEVVDVHGPMGRHLEEHRKLDPAYRLAGDGVHVNAAGHWLIARSVLGHWGLLGPGDANDDDPQEVFADKPHGLDVLGLVRERQRLLKDAWLTATGHDRPG